MGKRQSKNTRNYKATVYGVLLSLGLYMMGVALLALLAVKSLIPESAAFPLVAAVCIVAVFAGGKLAMCGGVTEALPAAMLNAVAFALTLLAVGAAFWQGIGWKGHGGVLLICVMCGGLAAGVLRRERGRIRKRK